MNLTNKLYDLQQDLKFVKSPIVKTFINQEIEKVERQIQFKEDYPPFNVKPDPRRGCHVDCT